MRWGFLRLQARARGLLARNQLRSWLRAKAHSLPWLDPTKKWEHHGNIMGKYMENIYENMEDPINGDF